MSGSRMDGWLGLATDWLLVGLPSKLALALKAIEPEEWNVFCVLFSKLQTTLVWP